MALDASIILRGQAQQVNPMETMVQGLSLRRLALQNQASEKELSEQTTINDILKNNTVQGPDGKTSLNRGAALSELYKVNPTKAMAAQKEFETQDFDTLKRNTETAKTLAWQASPENWVQVRQHAIQIGLPNADKLPEQFSPEFVQSWQVRTLNGQEQIAKMQQDRENQNKDRDFGLKKEELGIKRQEVAAKKGQGAAQSITELRKERSSLPTTKDTQNISAAYNKIQNAANNPSAAGDLSLIFGYMKMLDPGSTVREGEFANAQNAAGLPAKVVNAYNNALNGQKLNIDQRKDFINQAGGIYKAQLDIQNQIDSQYSNLAKKSGGDPRDVLLNFQANQPKSPGVSVPVLKTSEIEW